MTNAASNGTISIYTRASSLSPAVENFFVTLHSGNEPSRRNLSIAGLKKKKVKVPRSSREKFRFNKYIVINMICTRSGSTFLQIPFTIIYFSKMKSKRGSGSYIYGFKWRKSRANFRQRWNFKISPHRRHKSFHCMRWCCVTRHGQIWQYTRNPNNLPIKSRSGRIVASSDRSSLHV